MARQNSGFVLLHRKLNTSAIGRDGYACAIWMKLIMWANWKESRLDGKTIEIGQLVTGIDELSEHTGFHRSTVSRKLKLMEEESMLVRFKRPKGTLITILNYKEHQALALSHGTVGETDERLERDLRETDERQERDLNNNYNKLNNGTREHSKGVSLQVVKSRPTSAELIAIEKHLAREAARIKGEIIGAYRECASDNPLMENYARGFIGEPGFSILMRKYKTWSAFCREFAREYQNGFGGRFEAALEKTIEGYLAASPMSPPSPPPESA